MTGYELTRYDLPSSSQAKSSAALTSGDWPTAEPQHRVSQLYFDPVLRAKAQSMTGLNYLLGWCFERYEQTGDGVVAHISRADGSEHKVIRARYLVGADGAQSAVRRKMGSQLEGIPHLAQVSSTFLRSQRLQEINLENPAWMYRFFSRGRLGSLVAINGEDLWLYHAPMPSQNSDRTFDARQELFNAVGEEFDYEILNQEEWVARAMVVNRYRNRNVFVAGDAAHVWTPMGGFGMNAGIADATNLSWKLAGVMQGWADEKILDSYELERKPIGKLIANAAVKISTTLDFPSDDDPLLQADSAQGADYRAKVGAAIAHSNQSEFRSVGMQLGYYYEKSTIVCNDQAPPPEFSLDQYQESSWPGARAPHLWLPDDSSLYDQFGQYFTLLKIGENTPDTSQFESAALARKLPLKVVAVPGQRALEKYQHYPLVLVRPDQHIAWRGKTAPNDPGEVFDCVRGK